MPNDNPFNDVWHGTTDARDPEVQDPLNKSFPHRPDTRAPGVDETIVFHGRIKMEDVRRLLDQQCRLYYERHGHGNDITIETRPWLPQHLTASDVRRFLPESTPFLQQYEQAVGQDAARAVLMQRAGEFCTTIVTSGAQSRGNYPRVEMVTRIFDFTLLHDAVSGFSGAFENTMKEYWVLSRHWLGAQEVKYDYVTGKNLSMLDFYRGWLVARDLAIITAEQRLATRTAASIAQLLNDLNK